MVVAVSGHYRVCLECHPSTGLRYCTQEQETPGPLVGQVGLGALQNLHPDVSFSIMSDVLMYVFLSQIMNFSFMSLTA